jgi:hypothetical protein
LLTFQNPSSLGLNIRLDIIAPVSGKTNVEALAKRLGVENQLTVDKIDSALSLARFNQRPLTDNEFLNIIMS